MDEKTLETTNALAVDYFKNYSEHTFMEKFRTKFIELISGKKILDVGCGIGRDMREFNKKGFRTFGIDVSSEMLKIARQENPKGFLYNMDMSNMTFTDGEFDGVWCCSSLYHVHKREVPAIFKKFYDFLKKDGLLFLTVKKGEGEGYMPRDLFYGREKFYALYSPEELIDLLNAAGFAFVSCEIEIKDQIWINVFARKE